MSDNELLLAMSNMMDSKLEAKLEPLRSDIATIKSDIQCVKLDLENTVKPQIRLLAENYVPAARRYENAASQIEAMQADIDIMKKVITEHSEKLQKLA